VIRKWTVTIPELTGKAPRYAYAYIPDEARKNPKKRYPVLYMFDGHNVFFDKDATYGKSWGLGEYLDKTKTPLIVAAVECNHGPNHDRIREYSPFTFENETFGKIDGKAQTYMKWLTGTFKPLIDKRYPTQPDRKHTFIAGSSMGGLMSLYGVMQYNHVFSRAAALSPSIWFAEDALDRMLTDGEIGKDTVVYMDYGSRELSFHDNMADQFAHVATLLLNRRVMLNCRIVPGGNHCEASWEEQIPFFLDTLLYKLE